MQVGLGSFFILRIRNNPTKENRIKRALYQILKDDDMVERLYKIAVEQEDY